MIGKKRIRWRSKSRRYEGHMVYLGEKFLGLELAEHSQTLLAHDNNVLLRRQFGRH